MVPPCLRRLAHGRGGVYSDLFAGLRGGVPTEAGGAKSHLTFFYLRAFRFARRCRVLCGTVSGSGLRSFEIGLYAVMGADEHLPRGGQSLCGSDEVRVRFACNHEHFFVKASRSIEHEELTQKDIARKLGISQSYISRLEKRILQKLKVQMKVKAD